MCDQDLASAVAIMDAFERECLPSPLELLRIAPIARLAQQVGVTISIKRDDLIHPQISGNKWRKLIGNLRSIVSHGNRPVISFGGAYSNHLVALATAAQQLQLPMIAIIRGEAPPLSRWNSRLRYLQSVGVELHFVSREVYRQRHDAVYWEQWLAQYPNAVIIPEGGSNALALQGVGRMVNEVRHQLSWPSGVPDSPLTAAPITHWMCPIGSGGTTAGLLAHSLPSEKVVAISVLKGADDLSDRIAELLLTAGHSEHAVTALMSRLEVDHRYHFGGYARSTMALDQWVQTVCQQGVPVEPVYTGKLFFALREKLNNGDFPEGSHIVVIHTGGVWVDDAAQ